MHELGITQNILSTVLEHAERAGATRVVRVNLALGDLADVTEDSIRFYWEMIARESPAEDATLVFQRVAVRLRCSQCGLEFLPEPGTWNCPQCGQVAMEVLAGCEFRLDSIEVE